MVRIAIILCSVVALSLAGACSQIRGAKDVDTDVGADSMGGGPGVLTGKRGGIIIFQK